MSLSTKIPSDVWDKIFGAVALASFEDGTNRYPITTLLCVCKEWMVCQLSIPTNNVETLTVPSTNFSINPEYCSAIYLSIHTYYQGIISGNTRAAPSPRGFDGLYQSRIVDVDPENKLS
jgi:hypothetical protein